MYSGALVGARLQQHRDVGEGDRSLKLLRPRRSRLERAPNWNLTGARGKVTARCLKTACKTLTFGIGLLIIGTSMAIVGYYAQTMADQEAQAKAGTTKTESSLNVLMYVGPIIMGFGGFVIVAACVMTFEARDSAAKVVPARFRKSIGGEVAPPIITTEEEKRSSWEKNGICNTEEDHYTSAIDRQALTTAFLQFSRDIQTSIESAEPLDMSQRTLRKCPSAPNLLHLSSTNDEEESLVLVAAGSLVPNRGMVYLQVPSGTAYHGSVRRVHPSLLTRQARSMDQAAPETYQHLEYAQFLAAGGVANMTMGGTSLAVPNLIAPSRVDLCSDNPLPPAQPVQKAGSDASMAMDLHFPDCAITLRIQDESRMPQRSSTPNSEADSTPHGSLEILVPLRPTESPIPYMSDEVPLERRETTKRHPLLRQNPVDHESDEYEDENDPMLSDR